MDKSRKFLVALVGIAFVALLIAGFSLAAKKSIELPQSPPTLIWTSKELHVNEDGDLEFTGCITVTPPPTVTILLSETLSGPFPLKLCMTN